MNVLIACGGTGGHLFPGVAVGEELRARGDRVMLVVSEKEIDRVATENIQGMEIEKLPAIAMPPWFSPRMVPFGLKFISAVRGAGQLIERFHPDAVLGMGGFTCAAPILAARHRGIPTFLHESNAIPGKANRWLARRVTETFVGFEACANKFSKLATVTGTPVRSTLEPRNPGEARQQLGLHPDRFTLLILGGSQGARAINSLMLEAANRFTGLQDEIQFIHQTGLEDARRVQEHYDSGHFSSHVPPFLISMEIAYSAANLVVSRAGAATLTELAWYGLPSLLIPYPQAAENHQERNAEIFKKQGAAILLRQESLDGKELAAQIFSLRSDAGRLLKIGKNAQWLRSSDAIAKIIGRMDAHRRNPLSGVTNPLMQTACL